MDAQRLATLFSQASDAEILRALEQDGGNSDILGASRRLEAARDVYGIMRFVNASRIETAAAPRLSAKMLFMIQYAYARCIVRAYAPDEAADTLRAIERDAHRFLSETEAIEFLTLQTRCLARAGDAGAALDAAERSIAAYPLASGPVLGLLDLLAKLDPPRALAELRRYEAEPSIGRQLNSQAPLRTAILVANGLQAEALAYAIEQHVAAPNRLGTLEALANAYAANADIEAWSTAMDRYLKHTSGSPNGAVRPPRGGGVPANVLRLFSGAEIKRSTITDPPRIAVILCAHNAADTLGYAAASVLAQNYENYELVIVDDCSTDGTLETAAALAKADARVRVIANPRNIGLFRSKNEALLRVRADFYTCHDADDWMHPDRLAHAITAISADPSIKCHYSSWFRIDTSGKIDTPPLENRCSGLFSKQVIDDIGYFDQVRFSGDAEFQWRLRRRYGAAAIRTAPEVMSVGLRHSRSLTTQSDSGFDAFGYNADRIAYARAFMQWHLAADARALHVGAHDARRPFPIPARLDARDAADAAA